MKKQNENNWQYYGLFLDKDTRDKLISFINNKVFELQGKWYKTIEDIMNVCGKCVFCNSSETICETYRDIVGHCSIGTRQDSTAVIFVEVDKPIGIITSNLSDKKKLLLII